MHALDTLFLTVLLRGGIQTQPPVVATYRVSQRDKPSPRRVWSGPSARSNFPFSWPLTFKTNTQVICLPVGPRCDLCTLSREKICPSAQTVVKSRAKKAITLKPESGPKIEIAIEEASTLNLPKEEPASPCLSVVSSLTTVSDDA